MSETNVRTGASLDDVASEVARIKREIPFNGSYREQLAALLTVLFFKFGERPGASRIASMLAENGRSPSTSTAQDEINKFWAQIRKHSSIAIDRPDVPAPLLSLLSEFAGKAWQQCMTEAQVQFTAHRQEADAEVASALNAMNQAQEQVTQARVAASQTLRELQVANEDRDVLRRSAAREIFKVEELRKQVQELTSRLATEQKAREEETRQTQAALTAMRESMDSAVDEQRRLMTIGDEFKQQAARERNQRTKAEAANVTLTAEGIEMKKQLTAFAHERGVLEGTAAAQAAEIATLRQQLQAANSALPPKPSLRSLRSKSRVPFKPSKLR